MEAGKSIERYLAVTTIIQTMVGTTLTLVQRMGQRDNLRGRTNMAKRQMKEQSDNSGFQGDTLTVYHLTDLPNRSKDRLGGEFIFRLKVERSVRHPSAVTNQEAGNTGLRVFALLMKLQERIRLHRARVQNEKDRKLTTEPEGTSNVRLNRKGGVGRRDQAVSKNCEKPRRAKTRGQMETLL